MKEVMTMSDNKNKTNPTSDSRDVQIAKLAFIGASISTLGDGLQAVAAGLALEVLQKSSNQSSQNQNDSFKQTETMQKQIDYLINELKQIKRMMR